MTAAQPVPPARSAGSNSQALEPGTLERALVALLAFAALLWPFLWSPAAGPGKSVGNALVHEGLELVTGQERLTAIPGHPGRLPELASGTWWGQVRPGERHFRPVSSLVLGLGAVLSGENYDRAKPGLGPIPYKLLVVSLKVITSLLVVELAFAMLRKRRHAVIAGLLFATLPVHGAAVLDVAGVAELLSTAFALGAMTLWVRAGQERAVGDKRVLGAALLSLLAVLSKESALILPLVFFCLDLALAREGSFGSGLKAALGRLPAQLPVLLALATALALRYLALGDLAAIPAASSQIENPLVHLDPLTRFANGARVLVGSLSMLIGLNRFSANWDYSADYSAAQIPVLSMTAPGNLLGLGLLALALIAPLLLYTRCRTRAALFLALLASTLLASNLILPIDTLFDERLLFFPSALAVVFLAPFFARLGSLGLGAALVLSLGGGYWTIQRAGHWSDSIELWSYTSKSSSPASAKAHFNLGIANLQRESRSFAELSFKKATDLAPDYTEAWVSLAAVRSDDPEASAEALRKAIEARLAQDGGRYVPETVQGISSPALLLERVTRIMAIDPGLDPAAHLEWLGGLEANGYKSPYLELRRAETLLALGRQAEAEQCFKDGIAIQPTITGVAAYGRFLRLERRDKDATALFERFLDLTRDANASKNRAAMLEYLISRADVELAGDPKRALATSEEALDMNPEGQALQRALLVHAQALLDQPSKDPVAAADLISRAISELRRGFFAYPSTTAEAMASATILARLLPNQGNLEAISLLTDLIREVPESPTLRTSLGHVLSREGRFAEAATQFQLASEGLLKNAGDPLFDETYVGTRTSELFSLAAQDTNESKETLVQRLAEEAARGTAPGLAARCNYLAASGDFSAADEALNALEQAVSNPAQVKSLRARIERLEQLGLQAEAGPVAPDNLAERASLHLSILDNQGALRLAEQANQAAAEAPVEFKASLAKLLADCQEAAQGPQKALVTLEAATKLTGLSDTTAAALDLSRRRLEALLAQH